MTHDDVPASVVLLRHPQTRRLLCVEQDPAPGSPFARQVGLPGKLHRPGEDAVAAASRALYAGTGFELIEGRVVYAGLSSRGAGRLVSVVRALAWRELPQRPGVSWERDEELEGPRCGFAPFYARLFRVLRNRGTAY